MSWNIALNKFVELKNKFIESFDESELWNYELGSCIEYWAEKLGFQDMILPLHFTEFGNYTLVRYNRYGDILKNLSKDVDFWSLYDGLYMECRSVVLDLHEERLILTPFRKFFNFGGNFEYSETAIRSRIQQAKIIEFTNKLDGSMISARWLETGVVVAGSMALDRSKSFRVDDSIKIIESQIGYLNLLRTYPNYTFIFEFISEKDRHVVQYTSDMDGLYLIGIRDTTTGVELPYKEVISLANKYNIRTTVVEPITLDEVLNNLNDKKSNEAEGYVLNIDGFKVKIKYNDYVLMHRLFSELSSPNVIIQAIADDTWDDLKSKIPVSIIDNVNKVADIVFTYIDSKERHVNYWINELGKLKFGTLKDYMIAIDSLVPKNLNYYVKMKYKHKPYNYLIKTTGRYLRLHEIEEELKLLV